ncbi:hypothetical protein O3M35_010538 [Rhynocoris fuscipes]|uniref:Uncharacterized protein n=1 Tax=Rhynocoris fuscipes TaxID=488301 RepID=A0AAW1D708_9HEMI
MVPKFITCGPDALAVITHCGKLLTCGNNNYNKLGLNRNFLGVETMAVCGPSYTVAGILENALYFWGTRFIKDSTNVNNFQPYSTLQSQVVKIPQQILMLYASEEQIKKGEIVTLNSIYPLWHSIMVLVDTTVPIPTNATPTNKQTQQIQNEQNEIDSDTLGPVSILLLY